jgi:hypothetical protein
MEEDLSAHQILAQHITNVTSITAKAIHNAIAEYEYQGDAPGLVRVLNVIKQMDERIERLDARVVELSAQLAEMLSDTNGHGHR